MKRGFFITFEGPEGSGKSTHIALLARHLRERGYPVLLTREPGGTPLGERLRRFLLHTSRPVEPLAELLLYEAERAQHAAVLRPALRAGKVVLCDRYTDSTAAYQGFGRRLDVAMIQKLNAIASQGLAPALTLLLDVEASRGLKQAAAKKSGPDRLEAAGLAFHRRVRKGFLALARKEPKRFRIVKQQADVDQTQRKIRQHVDQFLNDKNARVKGGREL